jgi:hypothetical protein
MVLTMGLRLELQAVKLEPLEFPLVMELRLLELLESVFRLQPQGLLIPVMELIIPVPVFRLRLQELQVPVMGLGPVTVELLVSVMGLSLWEPLVMVTMKLVSVMGPELVAGFSPREQVEGHKALILEHRQDLLLLSQVTRFRLLPMGHRQHQAHQGVWPQWASVSVMALQSMGLGEEERRLLVEVLMHPKWTFLPSTSNVRRDYVMLKKELPRSSRRGFVAPFIPS